VLLTLFTSSEFSSREEVFKKALEYFSASSDEVRAAAAFAVGNIAVGNADELLPTIVVLIESDDDERKRFLSLHALKEFITHSSHETLASKSDSLWSPLFQICAVDGPPVPEPSKTGATKDENEAREKRVDAQWKESEGIREIWKSSEVVRNIAAECLGRITLTDPHKFLSFLQVRLVISLVSVLPLSEDFISPKARLNDRQAGVRAAVISAVRFTFSDDSTAYDELLAPFMVPFLTLMSDPDLVSFYLFIRGLCSFQAWRITAGSTGRTCASLPSHPSTRPHTTSLTLSAIIFRPYFPSCTPRLS
jgi:cullin-associated NEDD8-dissociated protein 1